MNLREELLAQADGLALMAEAEEVVAAHFMPAYTEAVEAWLRNNHADTCGGSRFWLLRQYTLDKQHDAQRIRREEAQLRAAADLLPA